MKSKIRCLIAGLLVAGVLTFPALAASAFPDVDENADYAEAIEFLSGIGIMQGDENGNFNPDSSVSRAEMATIICRMLGETEGLTTSNTFTDVSASYWANKYITKAALHDIMEGYGDGNFGPSDDITYEQALTIIIRATNLEKQALESGGYPEGHISIAHVYGYTANVSAQRGDYLTREQIAMLLFNVLSI